MQNEEFVPIQDIIDGKDPLARFRANQDCNTFEDFENLLAAKAKQYLELHRRIMSRDELTDKDEEFIAWVSAKSGVYLECLATYRNIKRIVNDTSGTGEASTDL